MAAQEPTKERLARELEKLNDPRLKEIIARARVGKYDDYETDVAAPQMLLVTELRKLGLNDFVQRVIDGEFDGTKEEAEAWYEREGKHLLLSDEEVRTLFESKGKPSAQKPPKFKWGSIK
ncbi:MAG: hypothetical protein M1546_00350 [Chloroflexi bacterium]|nr:hypothetical protein [Chloroflexota bacterium]